MSASREARPVRAGIYLRSSTEDQGLSLETQEKMCRQWCEMSGWRVVGVFKDESSGRDTDRPEYLRMMAESNRWDIMVVYNQTRVHRNIRNFLDMLDDLHDQGKQFVSTQEKIDTTSAYGWAFTAILAVWAELESRVIGERVTLGMSTARAKNLALGRTPIGLAWVKSKGGESGKYEIAPWALEVEMCTRTTYPDDLGKEVKANGKVVYSKLAGKPISRRSIRRIRLNLRLFREERVLPNKMGKAKADA